MPPTRPALHFDEEKRFRLTVGPGVKSRGRQEGLPIWNLPAPPKDTPAGRAAALRGVAAARESAKVGRGTS